MSRRYFAVLVVALSASLFIGCKGSNKRQAVSGTITFQGAPLEDGSISFLSTGERPGPVGGALIKNGRFEIPAAMGLLPGTYRVSISAPKGVGERTPEQIEAGASTPAKEQIPPAWNTASKVTIEVTREGPNNFQLAIE